MMATEFGDMDQTAVLHRLLEFSLAAADAETVAEIARALTELAAPLVGAANVAVATWAPGEQVVRVYQGPTATRGNESIRLVELSEPTPLTDAIRERAEVHVRSAESFVERFPKIARRTAAGEVTAMAAYPLILADEILGSCFFRFSDNHTVDAAHLDLMEQMVALVVRAIARIRDRSEILNYAKQLEQSNDDLEAFAAVVAHDLSAPVRRIGSFLQLLQRELGVVSEKADRYASTIDHQVQHLDALLRDTLAHAHVATQMEHQAIVDLQAVATGLLQDMAEDLEAVGAEVIINDLPVVQAVESLIWQVLQNLIDNSLKYRSHRRSPVVEITAEAEPPGFGHERPMWCITVQDNGIGIDPRQADQVFSMFTRLAVSDDRPGTGVGLAFVKRVVEQHGGQVGLAPAEAEGTGIWFTLPGIHTPDTL